MQNAFLCEKEIWVHAPVLAETVKPYYESRKHFWRLYAIETGSTMLNYLIMSVAVLNEN